MPPVFNNCLPNAYEIHSRHRNASKFRSVKARSNIRIHKVLGIANMELISTANTNSQ